MDLPESHAHPHHTGHRWVDYIIAGSALLVSVISLWLAIGHGHTMEKLVAANSWPNIENVNAIEPRAAGMAFSLGFRNSGVGPAFVETIEVWQGGRPVASVRDVLRSVVDAAGYRGKPLILAGSNIVGSVVPSRDTVRVLDVTLPGLAKSSAATLLPINAGLRVRVCFCSVFEECYVADSAAARQRPRRVDACPVPAQPFDDDLSEAIAAKPEAPGPARDDIAAARP